MVTETPFREAVNVAVCDERTVPVVAVKVPVVAPEATVAEAGVLSSVGFVLDRVMIAPPAGAALVRATVQVLEVLDPRLVGLHVSAEITPGAATKTLPPVAETGMGSAAPDAPTVLPTPIDSESAVGASATVTTAMPPSGIVFALGPVARQMYELASPAQLMLLPDEVSAALGDTEKPVTLPRG